MRVTVLGKYGRYAPAFGATSGYLLQNGDKNIVIDLGSGCLANLQKHIAIEDIDAIILSHLHFDHISDIFTLKYALQYLREKNQLTKKIKLFLPCTPLLIADEIAEANVFDVQFLTQDLKVDVGEISLSFLQMSHTVLCFGLRAVYNKKIFAYTGDSCLCESLVALVDGADLVVGDAMFISGQMVKPLPHMSAQQLASVVECRLLLSHLPHDKTDLILAEALAENAQSQLAQEGETYTI